MRLLVLLCLTLLAPSVTSAQDSSCATRTVLVSVLNGKWQTLTNLKAENFFAEAQDKNIQVIAVQPNAAPARVIVLLDTSGSMQGKNLSVAQRLAFALASTAPPRTEVFVYTFNNDISDFLGSSRDLQGLSKKLELIPKPKGRTAIRDCILKVLSKMPNPGSEDMVYLLTDGGDSSSDTTFSQLRKRLLRSGVRLSAAVFYDPWAATDEERNGPAELENVVQATGGFYTSAVAWDLGNPDKTALKRIDLVARLSNYQYKLLLRTPVGTGRSLKWKLKLKGLPRDMKGFKVRYPDELPACAAQSGN
jgi:hypothetical protein